MGQRQNTDVDSYSEAVRLRLWFAMLMMVSLLSVPLSGRLTEADLLDQVLYGAALVSIVGAIAAFLAPIATHYSTSSAVIGDRRAGPPFARTADVLTMASVVCAALLATRSFVEPAGLV